MTKAVNPVMARLMAAASAALTVDVTSLPIEQARQLFIDQRMPPDPVPHALKAVRDLTVPGPGGAMPARLYVPDSPSPRPLVIYAHGGGWTFGNRDTHGPVMHWLAALSGCAVLGYDYRLAPEHPFPAGHEDTLAAITYARSGALGSDCDAARLALSGDSAGANLVLGAMLALRDTGARQVDTAALFYGCYAPIFDTESHAENGAAYGLTTEMMRWYWANFLGPATPENAPPECAPLFAELAGLPPMYLNAAGLAPLLDDTTLLSARLARAGVRHRLDIFPGVIHGFLRLAKDLPLAREALAAASTYLRDFFASSERS